MLKQFNLGKTAVFIDAANILYSQRTLGWNIDYQKLAAYLRGETELVGLYYYTGKVGSEQKQNAFIKKIQSFGYTVIAKEVKFIRIENAILPKGNLDVELALDAFRLKDMFQTLLLFSGDSDFAYLLDLLKRDTKRTFVVSTRGHIAKELLGRAKYIPLPKLRSEIEMIKGPDKQAPEV